MFLHIAYWAKDAVSNVKYLDIAGLQVNDHILLAEVNYSETKTYTLRYYKSTGPTSPYVKRTTVKTILQRSDTLNSSVVTAINSDIDSRESLKFYDISDSDSRQAALDVLSALVAKFEGAKTDNFMKHIESLPEVDEFPFYEITGVKTVFDEESTEEESTTPMKEPATLETPSDGPNLTLLEGPITSEQLVKLITDVDPHLKYLGFSPAKVRHYFLKKQTDITMLVRDLILCFMAYAHIGNNISKLKIKRVNVDTSQKVLNAVSSMGVAKKVGESNMLTLPRIAISFMPEYLLYRKFLAKELPTQSSSSVSPVYQDVVFNGCETIQNMPGYKDFHMEFSGVIAKGGAGVDYTKDENKKEYARWNRITRNGYASDTSIHGNLDSAIAANNRSATQASDRIRTNIEAYKTYLEANPP